MKIGRYLSRIGYNGTTANSISTLQALHRAHLLAIPYENLDIHLGQRLTLDLEHIYAKIVEGGRGGWCYEMNGLFAWALQELGFTVAMLGSTVGAPAQGGVGNDLDHLILQVQLDQPWLVDVGFGNAFIEPLPLIPGDYQQGWMTFRLEQGADKWFFHNQPHGGAMGLLCCRVRLRVLPRAVTNCRPHRPLALCATQSAIVLRRRGWLPCAVRCCAGQRRLGFRKRKLTLLIAIEL